VGPRAVARATPLVVAPQAAAVSTGAVREVALVRNAHIVAGRAITITLACDHRILYGTQAGRFLNRITTLIEEGTL
jgi:pyruvate dehydrogenase E2 component (dihydrolipoamide acetyltransferase)